MTPELILWILGIAVAFCVIIAVFNYYENKQIRKRKKENDELSRKVAESLSKENDLDVDATKIKAEKEYVGVTKNPSPGRENALPPKPKQETVQELKEEIGEASLINEKVTADDEVIYETKRRKRIVVDDDDVTIESWTVGDEGETDMNWAEPPWMDAMRESMERAAKAGKTQADIAREIAREKQRSKPFYKDDSRKDWE